MNIKTVEYGLKINNITYDDITLILPLSSDDICSEIYGMTIETHPWNPDYIFISWGELEEDFPKKPKRANQIIKWFKKHLPKAKLKWQIIYTER
jgi:hypothetical protein